MSRKSIVFFHLLITRTQELYCCYNRHMDVSPSKNEYYLLHSTTLTMSAMAKTAIREGLCLRFQRAAEYPSNHLVFMLKYSLISFHKVSYVTKPPKIETMFQVSVHRYNCRGIFTILSSILLGVRGWERNISRQVYGFRSFVTKCLCWNYDTFGRNYVCVGFLC